MKRILSLFLTMVLVVSAFPGLIAEAETSINVQSVSLGAYHSAAIKSDGSLWMWGENFDGQLGDGTNVDKYAPVKIMDNVVSVSLGNFHSAAIKSDGSLWMWGDNAFGVLGDGTRNDKNTPERIMDNVVSVSIGDEYSAAIKSDGSLWMWGYNKYGQLGDGTTDSKTIPERIMDNVVSVSLGDDHSAAIKSDGSLWMWGYNEYGQLGDGTTDNKHTPVRIMDNVVSVSLGTYYSAAIKSDGSLWMWGYNEYGQLGDGTNVDKYTPVKIMDNVVSVSLGNIHSAAIKSDGSLWMWGYNASGQLGDGTNVDKYAPVKIMDNVVSVSLENIHSAAIKSDGSLWTWGDNWAGQLGDGTGSDKYTPVRIMNNVMLPENNSYTPAPAPEPIIPEVIPEEHEDDGFPESMTIDYNNYRNDEDSIYVDYPNVVLDIEDKNVAVMGELTGLSSFFTDDFTWQDIEIKSPGKTIITARYPDGRVKKCKLTVTGTKIMLNNKEITYDFDQPPVNQNGNLLVPIRTIAEKMGKTVLWSDETQTAFIDNTDNALIIPIGESTLYLGDETPYTEWETVKTNVPSQVINDRTLVPIRQFAESLGAAVMWNQQYSTANIFYNNTDSKPMSDDLFDAININYYSSNYETNPFEWYSDNILDEFYNSRNYWLDATTMGIGKPWESVAEIWSCINDGDTNASILLQQSLYDVLSNLPEDKSKEIDFTLLKTIKDINEAGEEIFVLSGGLNPELLENCEAMKFLNDSVMGVAKSKFKKGTFKFLDFGMFAAEEAAYILSDYTVNMAYLDVLEDAFRNQGILDSNMQEAINDLRVKYSDEFTSVVLDIQDEMVSKMFDVSVSAYTGKTWGVGKFAWEMVFRGTGVTKKGDALKTFYGIYCYNGALDREFHSVMSNAKYDSDISYIRALFDLQKAVKITAIDSIANMSNWWAKDEVNKDAEAFKNEINAINYYIWER